MKQGPRSRYLGYFYFDKAAIEAALRGAGIKDRPELGRIIGLHPDNARRYFAGRVPVGKDFANKVAEILSRGVRPCPVTSILVVQLTDGTRWKLVPAALLPAAPPGGRPPRKVRPLRGAP